MLLGRTPQISNKTSENNENHENDKCCGKTSPINEKHLALSQGLQRAGGPVARRRLLIRSISRLAEGTGVLWQDIAD